jgi:hypothetical protein
VTRIEKLIEKAIIVIESCATYDQLVVAVRYTELAVQQILQTKGFDKFRRVNLLTTKLEEHHIKLQKENI